ncbi:MBOAT family protein, partial [Lutimonas halocynthiae]|nr:MBOAT family protein [Lutimonas halocynthiae]
LLLAKKNRQNITIVAQGKLFPGIKDLLMMGSTFFLTLIAWVFFRAEDMSHAMGYLSGVFSKSILSVPEFEGRESAAVTLMVIVFFVFIEWLGRSNEYAIERLGSKWPKIIRWSWYALIIFLIGILAQTEETPFIYFQF